MAHQRSAAIGRQRAPLHDEILWYFNMQSASTLVVIHNPRVLCNQTHSCMGLTGIHTIARALPSFHKGIIQIIVVGAPGRLSEEGYPVSNEQAGH